MTLDVPIAPNLATPAWLGHPDSPIGPFATLELPITTPDPNAALLVTVYFQEKQSSYLRVQWKGALGTIVLADNFYEGTGMATQRSLLISPATLAGDGSLIFQSGGTTVGIQRIKLEWLESRENLVSQQVKDALVTPSSGTTVTAQSLSTAPSQTQVQAGAWDNDIVTVPISDDPVRIEEGVDFSVDLDQIPVSARLSLKEEGLPLGQHLVIWINEKRAGTITPSVPDLLDSGFFRATAAAANYVGWRDGSFFVPVALLKNGVNSVQFSPEDDATSLASPTLSTTSSTAPLALKSIKLQLNYQPPTTTPAPDIPTLHLSATAAPIAIDTSSP